MKKNTPLGRPKGSVKGKTKKCFSITMDIALTEEFRRVTDDQHIKRSALIEDFVRFWLYDGTEAIRIMKRGEK